MSKQKVLGGVVLLAGLVSVAMAVISLLTVDRQPRALYMGSGIAGGVIACWGVYLCRAAWKASKQPRPNEEL